ncbi:MAG TPA: hypothetical protein VI816_02420 [Candidatus Bathyarchaeia archaeon]|nr:hypothetical protein [Candidatus Bathyarchaeia archaeon]
MRVKGVLTTTSAFDLKLDFSQFRTLYNSQIVQTEFTFTSLALSIPAQLNFTVVNATIYFHSSSDGTSTQIVVRDGAYTTSTGPWYTITASQTIFLAVESALAIGTSSSNISTYLEVRAVGNTFYVQYPVYLPIR